jgi:hypothetical protein
MTGREMTLAVRSVVLPRKPLSEERGSERLLSTRRTVALVSLIGLVEVVWIGLLFELVYRAV